MTVTFPDGNSTTLSGSGQIQNVTPTSFTMVITLNAAETWRIRVNNPNNGGQSNTYNFTVRAAAPTIDNINPNPVTAGVDTTLFVTGNNFRSGFFASVTTPDGTFNIANSELTFSSSNEVRVRVTMYGTPQYTATLRIFYLNGQSTTRTFQVVGGTVTSPLAGTIGIWDGQKCYKLRGSSVTLQVYARLSSNPLPSISTCNPNCLGCLSCDDDQCIPATVSDSQYSFASNSFQPNTDYDIYVDLTYSDVISPGVNCTSSSSQRKSRLIKQRYRASTSSSQLLDFDFKPPLVMVHGIWSCFNKWHNTQNDNPNNCAYSGNDASYWESYARSLGFITFTPNYNYYININNENGFNDWESRASYVATQIKNNFVALTGNSDYPPWIYVAHSMGGLIGRVLTNKTDDSNKSLLRKLRRMYQLGTPNSGSWFTRLGLNESVEYLSPPYIEKTFNDRYAGFGSFSASFVKAYAGTQLGRIGDGLVSVDSVSKIILRVPRPFARDIERTLIELSTESFSFHHLELGSPDSRDCIFTNRILPDICSLPGGQNPNSTVTPCPITSITCNPDVLRPNAINRTQISGGASTQAAVITSQVASLINNQIINIPFVVNATDSILANGFVSSGSAIFSLVNPSGQVIDFSSLPPTAGEHITGEFDSFLVNNPVSGSWSLRATAGSSGATIAMVAVENSPLGFEGFAVSNIVTGQTAHLLGKWTGNQTGITSPSMTAQIINQSGTVIGTANLFDDGNHDDDAAGDGIFGGDTPALPTAGSYSIIFTAQGNLNGLAFARWAAALLDVVTPTHTLTGSFSDAAIDSDLDGAYDTIRETVELSVASAGGYLVTADLYDAQGYFISHSVGYLQANSSGVFSVDLDFSLAAGFCSQFASSFTVKNLTLSDAGSLTILDIYDQNPTTQNYDGSLFGCISGTPSPTIISVQPNAMFPGASGQIIISGNSFLNGAQVSFGTGVSVSTVTYADASTLLAQVSVSSGATPGLRDVTVTNPDGRSATATGAFTVATDQPPTVSINNVSNQQLISGIVTVSATANDDVGIQKVEFYVDGTLSGMDTSFPYQFTWDTNSLPNGTHTLAAKAYDTTNQNTTSQINVVLSCVSSFSPTNQSFPAEGGNGSITITSASICSWGATSNNAWITITSGNNGTGNGTVNYSVAANTGASRTGTITVAGQTFTVTQDASPTAITLISFAATGYDAGAFIEWQTGFEVDNLGFNIYREENGKRTLVNQQIVAGSALKAGASLGAGESYVWWDAAPSKTAAYWLEDLDLKGRSTMHGPFYAKAVGGAPPARSQAAVLSKLGSNQSQNASRPLETVAAIIRRTAQEGAQQAYLAGQPAVKISIKHEGWYRVSQKDLTAAGLPKDADSRFLQLYVGGREAPIAVSVGSDGRFDESSFIEFYGLGADTPSTDTQTYWLVAGKQPGKRIALVKGEGSASSAVSFTQTVERKDRSIYFAALLNGDKENFFGAVVAGSPVEQSLELRHLAQGVLQQAVVEITLQGVTAVPHRVLAQLNGISLGEVIFNGQENKIATFAAPHYLLREGANTLRLIPQNGAADVCLVDTIRLSYQQLFKTDSDSLKFKTQGGEAVTASGFSSRQVRVFDVTNPESPQEVAGKIVEERNGYSITVAPPERGERILLALTDTQLKQPAAIRANVASTLRDGNNQADVVMIASGNLFSAITPLKEARQAEGYRVLVAAIEDIYDEFNFGNKSPLAVKDFLAFAKSNWKVAPRFVLLAGDASYDAKNYLGLGDADLVPTKLIDTDYLETASDDWFVDFNEDGLPELAIGRLPVRDAEEAAAVVAKILRYNRARSPLTALLVSDRNDGFNFEQANTNIHSLLEPNLKTEELRRSQFDDATAKIRLLEALNRGQRFVNYVGHGSVNLWRGNLLTSNDALGLTNEALPVFVTMNCLNGYFQEATTDSLSEALMKAERGGAVAVWASSGLTAPNEQAAINQQFYRLLFDGKPGVVTLGEAAAKAKAVTADTDVRRTWILLGDPTMRVQ